MDFPADARHLDAHPDLRHDTQDLPEAEIMRLIGAPEAVAEGLFFPDTYLFAKRSSDVELLARAYRDAAASAARLAGEGGELPYRDAYQALIMASIVEKETGRAEDRSLVAGVFVNRLRQGMLLQTDPTVIYGLGEGFDGNLRKRDLLADTPYNTYTRPGLPPTPIAMPGLASLQAALHPAPPRRCISSHVAMAAAIFQRTLAEHNQAVMRYQKGGETLSHRASKQRGRFITFEGIDGAGKSSHIADAAAFVRGRGLNGGDHPRARRHAAWREAPRTAAARGHAPRDRSLLMFAARREHLEQVIEPALARGDWVICDRFSDATYAYQSGGRGLDQSKFLHNSKSGYMVICSRT
jgi:hypothetical protein